MPWSLVTIKRLLEAAGGGPGFLPASRPAVGETGEAGSIEPRQKAADDKDNKDSLAAQTSVVARNSAKFLQPGAPSNFFPPRLHPLLRDQLFKAPLIFNSNDPSHPNGGESNGGKSGEPDGPGFIFDRRTRRGSNKED
ncbi:hypothetical protein KM043_011673 [Ampulex compressa]|nr:hypothetical protein KM043_011673 [Ampulex compressa]